MARKKHIGTKVGSSGRNLSLVVTTERSATDNPFA
jgi:hypothetical protein